MLARDRLSTSFAGSFTVEIDDIILSERYPNEMCRVLWSVNYPGGHKAVAEFVLKFSDPFFATYGLQCYRGTNGGGINQKEDAARHLISYACTEEFVSHNRDVDSEVEIFFAELDGAGPRLSSSIFWTHKSGFRKA